ncbi:MAG: ATP-binding protein, partial [Rugosibacter sp.]
GAASRFDPLMWIGPRSLLWRTFLLVALLMLLSVAAWFAIFRSYEREPRARQLAQTLVSVANLTRAALVSARVEARRELLRDLSDREGIHIYPADADDEVTPLPDSAFLHRVEALVKRSLGAETRLTLEREGEQGLFISFRIDDTDDGEFWVALPRERIERIYPLSWIGWSVAALLLSLGGAWLIMFRITRPLKTLELAARKVGAGETPPPLDENGLTEFATVSRAFNQMSADLAQSNQDRALILAGISHDLRTPLTRLRMGIEMSTDEVLREGMIADVEEMDKTIGQFLDFARSDGGETPQQTDLSALLDEIAAQYQRRGFAVTFTPLAVSSTPIISNVRVQALRRAINNLIDNALRYAGSEQPVELLLTRHGKILGIEVHDRGPGIPADETERMKRPFTRLEAARSNTAGAGLGLAIVDRIARLHGGRLELAARPGGGLIAHITLHSL